MRFLYRSGFTIWGRMREARLGSGDGGYGRGRKSY